MDILKSQEELEITNYGRYLDLFPATAEARLQKGANGLGSSWSCNHGVLRWMEDCGCTTGSQDYWNQSWRAPLRSAFLLLKDELDGIFRRELQTMSSLNPQEVRNLYIGVMTGDTERDDFAAGVLGKDSSPGKKKKLFRLLESQKYAQYMFTSCGWFFADVTGVEPIQNMLYAYKALGLCEDLLSPGFRETFLKALEKARSNKSEFLNAKAVLYSSLPALQSNITAGAVFVIREILKNSRNVEKDYGFFQLDKISVQRNGRPGVFEGNVTFRNVTLDETYNYEFLIEESESEGMTTSFRINGSEIPYEALTLNSFPAELRKEIAERLHESVETA